MSLQMRTILDVCDNTGARSASLIGVLRKKATRFAEIGDIVTVSVKELSPDSIVKKGEMSKAVIVRTRQPIRRPDGSILRFDRNSCVLIDQGLNPKGTRIFGPVARELRDRGFLKIISLAPEVV